MVPYKGFIDKSSPTLGCFIYICGRSVELKVKKFFASQSNWGWKGPVKVTLSDPTLFQRSHLDPVCQDRDTWVQGWGATWSPLIVAENSLGGLFSQVSASYLSVV